MVTAFPLVQGKISLTTGVFGVGASRLVHCESDGTIKLTFEDGGTLASYSMIQGEDRALGTTAKTVEILSGTFSIA